MNHNEAVEQMAVERYLLNELAPDARDDFEEHMFGCQECALDTRVANVFIEEAKAQLSKIAPGRAKVANAGTSTKAPSKWLTWWRPAFAAPAFAALLVVIGYQNLVTLPSLRTSESEPSVVPSAPVYGATRGGARTAITANRELGISLPVDLPLDPGIGSFVSYSFGLRDPAGKLAWSGSIQAPHPNSSGDAQFSVVIPGRMLESGTYSLSISGEGSDGKLVPIESYVFDVSLTR
ncbi:MAG: zf-HC2 domain-containing protein [Terracidiphilus sp.]